MFIRFFKSFQGFLSNPPVPDHKMTCPFSDQSGNVPSESIADKPDSYFFPDRSDKHDEKPSMNLTIFKRQTIGYAAIMLLVIFLGSYVTFKLNQLNHLTHEITSINRDIIGLAERLLEKVFSQMGFEKKYLVSGDRDFYQKFLEIKEQASQDLSRLDSSTGNERKYKNFTEIKELYGTYLSLVEREVHVIENREDYPRKEYQVTKEKIIDEINRQLKTVIQAARGSRDEKIDASNHISAHILNVTTITAGLAIFIGIFVSFYNTRTIHRPITLLQKKTKDIAMGKFDEIHGISSPPEIKGLADDFNTMCERLQELDDMKKDFISHVSHKLRTPLTAIKEASAMLLEETYAGQPEKQKELLSITREECERLINSVNRILDLSRMEAGMMDYRIGPCALFPIIQKSVLKLAPLARRKKIDLELKPSSGLPLIQMDQERITQVMEDLIGNALKFTPEGGEVRIRVDRINQGPGECVRVVVADTGCGIPKENLKKIFDKFERIDKGREPNRGTGLGLSIAKYIITGHGGKIWTQSEPGTGSAFYFTLPIA